MRVEQVRYQSDDGLDLVGVLADGSGGSRAPAILVAHEAPGLTEHIKNRTIAFAEQGYVAFALDLFGAHDLGLEEGRAQATAIVQTPGLLYRRARAGLDVLLRLENVDREAVAAVGFCLGGATALELARHNAPIKAAIGFHPGLKRPAGSSDGPITARILMMIGDLDPIVPQEDRIAFAQSMNAAGADWELHVFGGVGHSYTNPDVDRFNFNGFRYNKDADRRSWAMALALLRDELKA